MIETTRFPDFKLVFHRCVGAISATDIRTCVENIHGLGPLPLEVWDFREGNLVTMGLEEVGGLLAEISGIVPRLEGEKTAMVISGSDDLEMAALFQRMAEFQEFPVELRSFQDLPSAVMWLSGSDWQAVLAEITPTLTNPDNQT